MMNEEDFVSTVILGLDENLITIDNYTRVLSDIVGYYVLPANYAKYTELADKVIEIINNKLSRNEY